MHHYGGDRQSTHRGIKGRILIGGAQIRHKNLCSGMGCEKKDCRNCQQRNYRSFHGFPPGLVYFDPRLQGHRCAETVACRPSDCNHPTALLSSLVRKPTRGLTHLQGVRGALSSPVSVERGSYPHAEVLVQVATTAATPKFSVPVRDEEARDTLRGRSGTVCGSGKT